jgi:TRAP-type C4-dicarboxylate transport system permease small subunit
VPKLFKGLKFGAELIGAFWFLVMFGAFLIQVFTRYVLNNPLGWTTEVSLIAFIWFAFWSAGLVARDSDHVRFDILYRALPPAGRRVASALVTAGILGLFLVALPANVDYVAFMGSDSTWVLEIPFNYVFAAFIAFLAAIVGRGVYRLWQLARRDWSSRIGTP